MITANDIALVIDLIIYFINWLDSWVLYITPIGYNITALDLFMFAYIMTVLTDTYIEVVYP